MSLLTPMKNIRVASLAGGSPYNHECYKFIPCPSSTDIQDFTDILSKFSTVLSHFGRVWLNYKPEHRRADSLCLLNKIHEEVAAELDLDFYEPSSLCKFFFSLNAKGLWGEILELGFFG